MGKELIALVGLLRVVLVVALIQPQFPTLPFTTIAAGEESGIRTREKLVITDQTKWEELWEGHSSHSYKTLPVPAVDFSQKMVIAVFGGIKSEGHLLRIVKIEKRESELIVYYSLIGPSCTKCSLPTGMI